MIPVINTNNVVYAITPEQVQETVDALVEQKIVPTFIVLDENKVVKEVVAQSAIVQDVNGVPNDCYFARLPYRCFILDVVGYSGPLASTSVGFVLGLTAKEYSFMVRNRQTSVENLNTKVITMGDYREVDSLILVYDANG